MGQELGTRLEAREIIVISDGSSDRTVERALSVPSTRSQKKKSFTIRVVDSKKRLGKNMRQNEIVEQCTSDILVLLDADTLPVGNQFLLHIAQPIMNNSRVGLVGVNTVNPRPRTAFEQMLNVSHEFKKRMYRKITDGNNLYTCTGTARALSRQLYRTMRWEAQATEDAFSYFYTITRGLKFVLAKRATIVFRQPATRKDYARQSRRFLCARATLERLFLPSIVKKAYAIPRPLFIRELLYFIITHPVHAIWYIATNVTMWPTLLARHGYTDTWEVATSSKTIQ